MDTQDNEPKASAEQQEFAPEAEAILRTIDDVVSVDFENEHEGGCLCTLTFRDGKTTNGLAPRTNDLAADQSAAQSAALAYPFK